MYIYVCIRCPLELLSGYKDTQAASNPRTPRLQVCDSCTKGSINALTQDWENVTKGYEKNPLCFWLPILTCKRFFPQIKKVAPHFKALLFPFKTPKFTHLKCDTCKTHFRFLEQGKQNTLVALTKLGGNKYPCSRHTFCTLISENITNALIPSKVMPPAWRDSHQTYTIANTVYSPSTHLFIDSATHGLRLNVSATRLTP